MPNNQAPFGWTVIRRDSEPRGFFVYKREVPGHYAADLAPFTFSTYAEAVASGLRGEFAYKDMRPIAEDWKE